MNSAGLRSKILTFKKVLKDLKPSVFFVQESKFKEEGKLKMDDYIIFEKLRQTKENGGGLLIGCRPDLKPVWVKEGEGDVETLSIDIFVKKLKIRCCVGYGCQEGDYKEKKDAFWEYLDNEVIEAAKAGSGLVIQMDGNLWAGEKIIKNDPRPQNNNGKRFEQFLKRNSHMTVVNNLNLCDGVVTRKRARNGKIEESVLDFFLVCNLVLPFVTHMVIDEERKHVLTNYEHVKRGLKANDTDHATLYMDVDLKAISEKPVRKEVWNLKNKKSQETFRKLTSETVEFSKCFESKLPIMTQINQWRMVLNRTIQKAFKKIRIKKGKSTWVSSEISNLIDRRNKLLKDQEKSNCSKCKVEYQHLKEIERHNSEVKTKTQSQLDEHQTNDHVKEEEPGMPQKERT